MHSKATYASPEALSHAIQVAKGERLASLVIKNAHYLDVFQGAFIRGDIALAGRIIAGTGESYEGAEYIDAKGCFLVPGFIDAHVHIESSLMTPRHFSTAVLPLGTTTAIWDPHEIANVKGVAGIQWALAASEGLLLDIFLMLPSCVPSTVASLNLETGAWHLRAADLLPFREHPRVLGLAEMMNYPGVLTSDGETLEKLHSFQQYLRDGHCPGLSGKELNAYCVSGVHSCHESSTLAEAQEKMQKGLHVLIREGSCAKNAATLLPLVDAYTSAVLGLCSDDRNPADMQAEGHINAIIQAGLSLGKRPEDLFRVASFAAARAYGLSDRGVLGPGYLADICVLEPSAAGGWQQGFSVRSVIKSGVAISEKLLQEQASSVAGGRFFFEGNNLAISRRLPQDFALRVSQPARSKEADVLVMQVIKNQIITEKKVVTVPVVKGEILADTTRDIVKISVIERHLGSGRSSTALVSGFNLKVGAIAGTIAHDCHNIIVVGVDAEAMANAVNYLRSIDGGIVVWKNLEEKDHLALPIAGLMSEQPAGAIAETLNRLISLTKTMGCELDQPFLQLSFLALPVIGKLKISDRGLIDVEAFAVVNMVLTEH